MATEKRLIDANAALAKRFTAGLSDASGNYYGYADIVFVDDIENSPTVDAVEVVHAYWKGDEPGDWHCSRCGELASDAGYEQTKYCPNCGAKMDGDGDG